MQIKQHGNVLDSLINVTLLHYNRSTIIRVPLDVLSTELSMAFSDSNQYFFTHYFYIGVNFCERKMRLFYSVGTYFYGLQRPRKNSKN